MSDKNANKMQMLKYHVMNTVENTVNTGDKRLVLLFATALASGGYLINAEMDNWGEHFDNQGIEAEQQAVYKTLSEQIVDFQETAETLPIMYEKLEYYDDIDFRTQDIIDKEATLKSEFEATKEALNKKVKEISITAFNSGNEKDGLAISEKSFDELWKQLTLTEPDLRTLKQNFDIQSFPSTSVAYLDECRIETKINPDAPFNVQYNAASEIASCADGTSVGNSFMTIAEIAGVLLIVGFGANGINSRRKSKYGYSGKRPKPKGQAPH